MLDLLYVRAILSVYGHLDDAVLVSEMVSGPESVSYVSMCCLDGCMNVKVETSIFFWNRDLLFREH